MRLRDHNGCSEGVVEITPSDTEDVNPAPEMLWITGKGDLAVEMLDGSTATIGGAFDLLPISVRKVLATGTTATGILGFY